jgi:small ligand-binding sensory domain FIST
VKLPIRRLSEFLNAGKVTVEEFGENAFLQLMRLSVKDAIELVRTFNERDFHSVVAHMDKTCVPSNFRPSGAPFVVDKQDSKAIAEIEDRFEPKYRAFYEELVILKQI